MGQTNVWIKRSYTHTPIHTSISRGLNLPRRKTGQRQQGWKDHYGPLGLHPFALGCVWVKKRTTTHKHTDKAKGKDVVHPHPHPWTQNEQRKSNKKDPFFDREDRSAVVRHLRCRSWMLRISEKGQSKTGPTTSKRPECVCVEITAVCSSLFDAHAVVAAAAAGVTSVGEYFVLQS